MARPASASRWCVTGSSSPASSTLQRPDGRTPAGDSSPKSAPRSTCRRLGAGRSGSGRGPARRSGAASGGSPPSSSGGGVRTGGGSSVIWAQRRGRRRGDERRVEIDSAGGGRLVREGLLGGRLERARHLHHPAEAVVGVLGQRAI